MKPKPHLLVVEDDPVARSLVVEYFEGEGWTVSFAGNGASAIQIAQQNSIDVVILDINLPDTDGFEVTRKLRPLSDVGIIMATSRKDEIDRIVGLELGADDYVIKPYNIRELFTRAKNLQRRVQNHGSDSAGDLPLAKTWIFLDWYYNYERRELGNNLDGIKELTEAEHRILNALICAHGRPLSRDQLMDAARNREWSATDRTIDVLVGRLRRKMNDDGSIIGTVQRVGYRFTPKVTVKS